MEALKKLEEEYASWLGSDDGSLERAGQPDNWNASRPAALKVRSPKQQHQHYLRTC